MYFRKVLVVHQRKKKKRKKNGKSKIYDNFRDVKHAVMSGYSFEVEDSFGACMFVFLILSRNASRKLQELPGRRQKIVCMSKLQVIFIIMDG